MGVVNLRFDLRLHDGTDGLLTETNRTSHDSKNAARLQHAGIEQLRNQEVST